MQRYALRSASPRAAHERTLARHMLRIVACALVLALIAPARADTGDDAARALREDGSVKVRAQAAIVLGQRGEPATVAALAEALASDEAAAVRIAAAGALGRLRGDDARTALEQARRSDADRGVREAASLALEALGLAFSIEEPAGSAGGAEARRALRQSLARLCRRAAGPSSSGAVWS